MCPMQAANLLQLMTDLAPSIVALAVIALFFARRMA
jgi:hypothetical protein